jgi:3-deoxy-D-manno-octulosonate 8-phosphate phosphatase (KDO 8-P phosphatase)
MPRPRPTQSAIHNPRSAIERSAIRNPRSAIGKSAIERSAIAPRRWAAIRLFAMDVDGVLTDGTVQISSDGTEAKSFSILDGLGLILLNRAGIITAWISGRASLATTAWAQELKIPHLVQGRIDKLAALQELALQLGINSTACAYMGDDTIDVAAIEWSGIGIAPHEAMSAALAAADYVTARSAGRGAVREVCERLLASQGRSASGAGSRGKAGRSNKS